MHLQIQPAYNRLKTSLEDILRDLEKLDETTLNRIPAPGKWSCAQIMLHINLSIGGTLSYLHKKLQQPELIEKSGIAARFRSSLLNAALRSDIKFKAPKGLDNLPEYASFSEIQSLTQQNLDKMEQFLSNFPSQLLRKNVFKHPAAGRINIYQTLAFLDAHALHHKRQIAQIIKNAH